MKLQIQDDHNRSLLMREDHLTLLTADRARKLHSHVTAHLTVALSGDMLCNISGERVKARGICIAAGVEHAIDTTVGELVTLMVDPDSILYQILLERYLRGKQYCVLSKEIIQDIQAFYRHCGADVEILDLFIVSLLTGDDKDKRNVEEWGSVWEPEDGCVCRSDEEQELMKKMRSFYNQIGRVKSITQASANAGFATPSNFAQACVKVFGISIHDLLCGRRGYDVMMDVPVPEEEQNGGSEASDH